MRKVLHLRSSFDPGGTETLLTNLFNYPQEYFDMHLALLKKGSLILQLRQQNGNRLYHLYRKRFFDVSVFKKLCKLVEEQEIEVVHTHQLVELLYAVALKMVKPRLKLVHQIHLMFSKRNFAFYLERFLSQKFTKVITVSQASKNDLTYSFGFDDRNISLLYNGICLANTENVNGQVLTPRLKKGMVNIVMVANFIWGKDHETLFKSYDAFIREQLPLVNFYFIGRETDISERLKRVYLTDDDIDLGRIVFTGPIANAWVLLPMFDMVIMSCFSETFNLALVEAAAMGKLILASDIPVFRELSEDGKYFHLFKTGDARHLFESLSKLVANLPELSRVNNSQYYRNKFGFDNYVRSLNAIYSS